MLKIISESECCGCSACVQVCPKQCIVFSENQEGFRYPSISDERCIHCGLCQRVCPAINKVSSRRKPVIMAGANNQDAIRKSSSSGGVFFQIAERVISQNGVVFGAKWDENWEVIHGYVETVDGLAALQGSKYSQSVIGTAYKDVERELNSGRMVLFSGTPCQIAGLKCYLRNSYDNLMTVECVCHGVPSPSLWRKYLKESSRGREVSSISHRDKCSGWRNYSVAIDFTDGTRDVQTHDENPWTRAFIKNLTLRPSCYNCAYKCVNSSADITLGDFWGIEQLDSHFCDDEGVSMVILHTSKGIEAIGEICLVGHYSIRDIARFNTALFVSAKENPNRSSFFEKMQTHPFVQTVESMTKDSLTLRIKRFIRRII